MAMAYDVLRVAGSDSIRARAASDAHPEDAVLSAIADALDEVYEREYRIFCDAIDSE